MDKRSSDWLGVAEFAEAAGLPIRTARYALASCFDGRSWRGQTLEVRCIHGRGGKSGISYEVSLRSLSEAVGEPLSAPAATLRQPRRTAKDQGPIIAQRFKAIEPALALPPRSSARAAAIASQAKATGNSERTLSRWIESYEAEGFSGLGNRRPSNAGQARVVVSREFDTAFRAAGYDDALLSRIGAKVTKCLKGAWASRAEAAGWAEVGRLVEFNLLQACEAEGVKLPEGVMSISRRHVERFAHFRVVNKFRNDRKAFDDAKPRIHRDWTQFQPMQCVVADVKHLDVIVTRADGSPAWPKVVAFYDAATGRLFVHMVLCERGESIRQEHVIEALLAMIADPEWGFPSQLYLDNGSEFAVLSKLRPALEQLAEAGARTIIHAKPYNASAKPIEAAFARLDRYVFSMLPGYAGGQRMNKKTQTVGRPPAPYPHGWDQFERTVQSLVGDYHHRPMGGQWGNRSPAAILAEKVAAGWRPVHADLLAIDSAFCTIESRRVDRGIISFKGVRYHHPSLSSLPSRTVVQLAVPWRRGADPLFQAPGATWAYLAPDMPFQADWTEGARESGKRQRAQTKHLLKLVKDAGHYDPVATKLERQARRPKAQPMKRDDFLPASALMDLAEGRLAAEQEKPALLSREEIERRREEAETLRLERRFGLA